MVLTPAVQRCGRGPFVLTTANEVGTLRPCAWGVPWLPCVPSTAWRAVTGHRNLRPFRLAAEVCGIRHTRPRGSAKFQVSCTHRHTETGEVVPTIQQLVRK